MAVVGNLVGKIGHLRFKGAGFGVKILAFAGVVIGSVMLDEALACFPGEIEAIVAGIFLLKFLHDAQALAVVLEATVILHQLIECVFALMPKW